MIPAFEDRFGPSAIAYAEVRPGYPPGLYSLLKELVVRRGTLWDCATGSGQALAPLAPVFDHVIASDASAAQLRQLPASIKACRVLARAEATPFPDRSFDLVTVAQALHWFAGQAFYGELHRVLRPDGLFAAWTYGLIRISPAIDAMIDQLYSTTLGAYWPHERRHVDTAYRELHWPPWRTRCYEMAMTANWSLETLLAYLGTWSAVNAYRRERAADPLKGLGDALETAWPGPEMVAVRWPLSLRVAWRP